MREETNLHSVVEGQGSRTNPHLRLIGSLACARQMEQLMTASSAKRRTSDNSPARISMFLKSVILVQPGGDVWLSSGHAV